MYSFGSCCLCRYRPEAQTALEDDLDLAVQSDQLSSSDASSLLHGVLPGQYKEGTELGVPQHGSTVQGGAKGQVVLQDGPGQDLDHELDDTTAMKRRAQVGPSIVFSVFVRSVCAV
jgi:hypothetical protein